MSTIFPTIYVPLGCPGSGKGTFSQFIQQQEQKYVHISTGDLLRDELAQQTPFGLKYAHAISNHVPGGIPSQAIEALIHTKFEEILSANQGILLDGFPKTLKQCEQLDLFAQKSGLSLIPVWIQVDEATALDRISLREVCEKCQKIYHAHAPSPCTLCDTPLTTRMDDTPEIAHKRVNAFHDTMDPVLSYYRIRGRLYILDGNGTPEECASRFEHFHHTAQFRA